MPTTTYTAAAYLAAYEPAVLTLMADPTDLSGDTQRADAVATQAGLPVDPAGRYPVVVWFAVFG